MTSKREPNRVGRLSERVKELEVACRILVERAHFGIDDDAKLKDFERAVSILEKKA